VVRPNAEAEPLVSIVTPAFQASRFIEQTILSVLGQDYRNIEYIVMDGGSTDGTTQILDRYRGRLTYVSAPDGGAPDAINRGFERSRGEIFAWLNADDLYLPGAIRTAVQHFARSPHLDVVYGEGIWIDEEGKTLGRYPTLAPYRPDAFQQECGICQPAAFLRRDAFVRAGMLQPELHLTFDYDLWIRLSRDCRFEAIPQVLAASRMHRDNKSLGSRGNVFAENIAILRKHYGYVPVRWIYAQLAHRNDGRDQFFEPMQHSVLTYLATLPAGLRHNYRQPWRYLWEWASRLTPQNIRKGLRHEGATDQDLDRSRP
jgi:glycosyltransferase involved in cell wall biosynthesis